MKMQTRRQFLRTAVGTSLVSLTPGVAPALEPFQRPGKPNLLPSLAAYSFRNELADLSKFDLFQFIDYCADQGMTGAELTSYYFPKEVDDDYLLRIRRHAFLRGVAVSGTAVGNNFALPRGEKRDAEIAGVKQWIDRAALMGAPHIRVFAGAPPKGVSHEDAMALCIEALEECAAYAGKKGIFLGIENHGGIVAEPEALLAIVKAVKSPWVGVNLDTGNFHTKDPYGAVEACAPYAVNVQVKVEMKPADAPVEWADLGRLAAILRKANYQGFVVLEYEAKEDPRKAVPGYLEQLKALCAG